MKDIQSLITKAEKRWLGPVFEFIKKEFEASPLPSHDHFHHLRVWKNARFLLSQLIDKKVYADYTFIESLLIASLFHDTGMIKTHDESHGKESKEICQRYFLKSEKPAGFLSILEAVEKHDDKSYKGAGQLISKSNPNLIAALGICDDLDAFGYIGIYRFSEIYLMRGIPMEDLGLKIIANLSGRFRHFIANCTGMDKMITTYLPLHTETENFFRYYNLQIRKTEQGEQNQNTGAVAVIKQIYRHSLMGAGGIQEVCESVLKTEKDPYVTGYFSKLNGLVNPENYKEFQEYNIS